MLTSTVTVSIFGFAVGFGRFRRTRFMVGLGFIVQDFKHAHSELFEN